VDWAVFARFRCGGQADCSAGNLCGCGGNVGSAAWGVTSSGKAGRNDPDDDGHACPLGQILTAKTVASMVLALESTVVTAVALYVIHGITLDYAALLLFVVVAGAAHAAIGFALSLNSKDFNSMLGLLMVYMFVFTIPSILFSFGIVDAKYEWLFMISPSHSAHHLIASAVREDYQLGMVFGGCLYLAVLAALLFKFAVYPKFKSNAARG